VLASFGGSVLIDALGGVAAVFIIGIAGAVGKTYKTHQETARNTRSIAADLYDTPADPVTHTPLRKGWTTRTDERITKLEYPTEVPDGKHAG
jgi:hypothetical protein